MSAEKRRCKYIFVPKERDIAFRDIDKNMLLVVKTEEGEKQPQSSIRLPNGFAAMEIIYIRSTNDKKTMFH